jgi:hypothetical protein
MVAIREVFEDWIIYLCDAMRGMFASIRGSLSAPVTKHGKLVLSFYNILINVCMYRNWREGINDTTALSLAGKGTVVAEKRSSRSTLHVPFPLQLNTLYMQGA